MKNCEDYIENISADLDGELSAEEKAALEAHLAECTECRSLRDELAAMHDSFPLTDVAPPDTLTPGILYKTTVETSENPWRRRIAALVSVAACVALLLWIGQNNNFLSPTETDMAYSGGDAAPGVNGGGASDPEADGAGDALPEAHYSSDDGFLSSPTGDEQHAFTDFDGAVADDASNDNPASEPAYLARYAADTDRPVRYVIVMENPDVFCEAHAFDLSEELSDGSYLIPLEIFENWIGEGRVRMENDAIVITPDSTDVLVISDR